MTSKNRSVLQIFRGIIACRNSWGALDTDETLIRAATRKGLKENDEELYVGQSVRNNVAPNTIVIFYRNLR